MPGFKSRPASESQAPAETVETQARPDEIRPALTSEPPPSAPAPTPREPTEVVITQADPARPKKGGWWQRAKETLGGG